MNFDISPKINSVLFSFYFRARYFRALQCNSSYCTHCNYHRLITVHVHDACFSGCRIGSRAEFLASHEARQARDRRWQVYASRRSGCSQGRVQCVRYRRRSDRQNGESDVSLSLTNSRLSHAVPVRRFLTIVMKCCAHRWSLRKNGYPWPSCDWSSPKSAWLKAPGPSGWRPRLPVNWTSLRARSECSAQ